MAHGYHKGSAGSGLKSVHNDVEVIPIRKKKLKEQP